MPSEAKCVKCSKYAEYYCILRGATVACMRANNLMDSSIDNSMSNSTSPRVLQHSNQKNAKNWHTNIVTVTMSTTNKYYK